MREKLIEFETAEHYRIVAKENPCEGYISLLNAIKESANLGLFIYEFNHEFDSWFKDAHRELLEDKGFIVNVFELNIASRPLYVSISWDNIKPTTT